MIIWQELFSLLFCCGSVHDTLHDTVMTQYMTQCMKHDTHVAAFIKHIRYDWMRLV